MGGCMNGVKEDRTSSKLAKEVISKIHYTSIMYTIWVLPK